MSMFTTFIQKEAQLKTLEAELASMKADTQLQKEIEFKEKLEALMEKHDASKEFVLKILAPEQVENKKTRKPRKLKTYKNPHTGEILKVRGGNQTTLKAWKKEHGGDTVEGWVIEEGEQAEQNEQATVEKEATTEEPKVDDNEAGKVETKTTAKKTKAPAKQSQPRKKRELPIGMKPAPKSDKPKFKFVPSNKKVAEQ